MNPNRSCESGCRGTEKKALDRSITENHCSFGVIWFKIVCGFATTGGIVSVISLIALRSCTNLYFPVFAFFTGNIGVLHVVVLLWVKIPAFNMSAITDLIPSRCCGLRGYCGLIGLKDEIIFTLTGSWFLIRPTSVAFGRVFSSSSSSFVRVTTFCQLVFSSSRYVLGVVLTVHPNVRLRHFVFFPSAHPLYCDSLYVSFSTLANTSPNSNQHLSGVLATDTCGFVILFTCCTLSGSITEHTAFPLVVTYRCCKVTMGFPNLCTCLSYESSGPGVCL